MAAKFIQRFAIFVVALLFVEGIFQVASLAIPRVDALLSPGIPGRLPDALLRFRPNPALADHDVRGWRNQVALERADIVTLGDSQTYGDEVARANAWPTVLGALLDIPTYNMACSAYGPMQYLLVADEAIALEPKLILVGVYAGNDFVNAYRDRSNRDVDPGLDVGAPHDAAFYKAVQAERGSLSRSWNLAKEVRVSSTKRLWRRYRPFFEENSKLYALFLGLSRSGGASESKLRGDRKRTNFEKYAKRLSDVSTDIYFPFRAGVVSTIFTPSARLGVVDTRDPRVVEGVRVTMRVIEEIQRKCGDQCQVATVFIPTKEYAFEKAVLESTSEIPLPYRELVRYEGEIWQQFGEQLDERGLIWIDSTQALRDAIQSGRNPYLADWNGHPNVTGNEIIAQAVAKHSMIQLLSH